MTYLITLILIFSLAMAIFLATKSTTDKVDKYSAVIAFIFLALMAGFMLYLEYMYYAETVF